MIGFVDIEGGAAQFYHDLRFLYFEINFKFIEFEAINQFSKLRINVLDSVEYKYEIGEDMVAAKSSVAEIILNDTMADGNELLKIMDTIEHLKD